MGNKRVIHFSAHAKDLTEDVIPLSAPEKQLDLFWLISQGISWHQIRSRSPLLLVLPVLSFRSIGARDECAVICKILYIRKDISGFVLQRLVYHKDWSYTDVSAGPEGRILSLRPHMVIPRRLKGIEILPLFLT